MTPKWVRGSEEVDGGSRSPRTMADTRIYDEGAPLWTAGIIAYVELLAFRFKQWSSSERNLFASERKELYFTVGARRTAGGI
jgi:hypothetical protein